MKATTDKLYKWATQKATSTTSPLWIGLLFLLEIAMIIPPDPILMFFCLQNPRKTLLYVLIATVASVISGVAGYLLGHFLWDLISPYIVPHLIAASTFDRVSDHFQLYEHWAVFFGTLVPFPLKILSLTAGAFHLGLGTFIGYMALARILRFSLIGTAMFIWGNKVRTFLDRHFHRVLLFIGAKTAVIFLFFWAIAR